MVNHWHPPQLQEAFVRPGRPLSPLLQKKFPCEGLMRPPEPTKDRGFNTKMKKKKEEEKKGRVGENKKREKNVGYARLIFRASEECAEALLVSPFSASVPMKRDGEVVGLGFLRSFS